MRDFHYGNSVLSIYKSNPLIKISETGKKIPEYFFLGPEEKDLIIRVDCDLECEHDYESIVNWNIPRVWLRRKYGKRGNIWDHVFMPFHELEHHIKDYEWKDGIAFFVDKFDPKSPVGLKSSEMKRFLKSLERNPEKISKRCSIMLCALIRIIACNVLNDKCDDPRTRMILHLFIDTHIDLINAIALHSAYLNPDLLDKTKNSEDFISCLYELHYPHDMRFYHSGDLPDLTSIVGLGGLWYSHDVKSGPKGIVHALIHVLSSKTQSYRCQGRNNMKILREDYFPKFPEMLGLYKQFMRVSLLGNYVFCNQRPTFATRIKICNFFDVSSDSTMIKWMSENESIVKYTTKEYFDYLVKCTYSLDQIFEGEPTRKKMSEIIVNTMDEIRKLICSFENPFSSDQNLHIELKKIYVNCHNLSDPFISKLKKGRFDEVVFEACEKAAHTTLVNQKSTNSIESEKQLDPEVVETMEMVIYKYYMEDRNLIGSELDVRWFKMFGISKMGYKLLKNLIYDYTFNDMADSAIFHSITDIYNANHKDFHILHTFFLKLYDFHDSIEYALPKQFSDSQIKALRAKYRIHPWEDLPEYVKNFYYCEICKRWAHSTVTQITSESARAVYAIGTENCLFDIAKQQLVCGNQPVSASIKKLKENGKFFEETTENTKDAKIIRKYKTTEGCSATPFQCINMIGTLFYLGGKPWALCTICASLTLFVPCNFGNLGFTCGCHDRSRDEFVYMRRISQINSGNTFYKTCFYCEETSKTRGIITIRVLDDKNGLFEIKDLDICVQDFERCKSSLFDRRNDIVRKSKLFEIVGSARTKSIENRMTKQHFHRKP